VEGYERGREEPELLAAALPALPQVAIEGPHDLQEVALEQVVTEILKELRRL